MDVKKKLVELIGKVQDEGVDYAECFGDEDRPAYVKNDVLADHLIANGVTVQGDELPTNCKQLWIPASEPPDVYRDEYGELIPFLVCEAETEYPYRAMYDGKVWGDGFWTIPVTHWMPLPVPPKGK